ncbi:uncharacterized protein LOC124940659 isoform X2 [Impatiens glandulifera]|uniref:uncharacterized protein LOC124940659 isoform X2 n=1 Tax=Impatiens glandulifera TaxID=253017 RepID=UPI001FB0FE9C|nr:uncharacterized protein LOC124940659 isoform X2 [Impatiens glandulifera]
MASLQLYRNHFFRRRCNFRSEFHRRSPDSLSFSRKVLFSKKLRLPSSTVRDGGCSICCHSSKSNSEIEKTSVQVQKKNDDQRPPFDIDLAVVLAGFAFEAYSSPPENIGYKEVDATDCKTIFISESFMREIYDGEVFIKLKKGLDFPAMDPWGTSDPYVVLQLDNQVVKSNVKWGTKEPTWNEDFALHIKQPTTKNVQVAAWDANLVTPHKRMGNSSIDLGCLCDGNLHEVLVELEGMGGGGKIQLEIRYKSFDEIEEEKKWWNIPIITEFLKKNGFDSALNMLVGSETIQAREFVEYAFGQIKSLNESYLQNDWFAKLGKSDTNEIAEKSTSAETEVAPSFKDGPESYINDTSMVENGSNTQASNALLSDGHFWKSFSDLINHNVVQRLGLPAPEKVKWDGFELLNRIGIQSQKIAEAVYIESGLATSEGQNTADNDITAGKLSLNNIQTSLPDIKKVTQDVLRQTDSVLGALMVLNAAVAKLNKEARLFGKSEGEENTPTEMNNDASGITKSGITDLPLTSELDEKKAEEMRVLFSSAESAMEAWAMLATSLGHPSFIKSEFEKISFLDNPSTDTQVAIWRDRTRKRLVIAFRGTEQSRWKDLRTDLMVMPTGLNPERIGGDFKQEVQVHSGFLSAYDSVRMRILSLIKMAVGFKDDDNDEQIHKWTVYVTGHSLGGALATLLALELASSQLAKLGAISVTMYNFGSPRVGNKIFAELYNEKVKDSWRVVNHRDIIPTIPRLMGYCHVAHPIYLATGDLKTPMENMELIGDGYEGDVIGEATPDVLVSEFMKGEKELIEKILNTEINIFRSIRDGSALMQHMEDFYYISLLENVRSNYQVVARSQTNAEGRRQSIG